MDGRQKSVPNADTGFFYTLFGKLRGRLHVDTWTDPDLFLKGFDFISGAGAAFDDMNFSISALYEMF